MMGIKVYPAPLARHPRGVRWCSPIGHLRCGFAVDRWVPEPRVPRPTAPTAFVAARASRQERFEAWSATEHLADDERPKPLRSRSR
jgi:hypothetical protein